MPTLEEKKNDPQFMKEYLKHALEFEKYVFLWQCAYEIALIRETNLNGEEKELLQAKKNKEETLSSVDENAEKNKRETEEKLRSYKSQARFKKKFLIFAFLLMAVSIPIAIVTKNYTLLGVGMAPCIVYFAFKFYTAIFGVFLGGFLGLNPPESKEEKKQKMATYEENLKSDYFEKNAQRQKEDLQNQLHNLCSVIDGKRQEISTANVNLETIEKSLTDANETLKNIYALNVLPAKYRSLTAVATLYEYLENGVCTTVQGHGGIYDTYEYHVQIGRIIAKLDVIIEKLDEIANNQEMLYEAITESNQILQKINEDIAAGNQAFSEYAAASLSYQRQQTAAIQWHNWCTY